MKPPEVRKYLFDIAEACGLIESFVAGKSFDDYATDALLRSGVERQFEIAGEALARLLQIAPDLSRRISDTRRIISFRNRLIHGYASVADEIVWGVVEANLRTLKDELQALLERGLRGLGLARRTVPAHEALELGVRSPSFPASYSPRAAPSATVG